MTTVLAMTLMDRLIPSHLNLCVKEKEENISSVFLYETYNLIFKKKSFIKLIFIHSHSVFIGTDCSPEFEFSKISKSQGFAFQAKFKLLTVLPDIVH